ncbi:MAG: phage Gp37/Gp68 family protein [Lachnospiraceae bacterium]|nr:phage Gp37/Gp68 family protein [Lachnospiraceae bacterium]
MSTWNPWHGCTRASTGCLNCYVYRRDSEFGRDASVVKKTASFNLPVRKNRQKEYKLKPDGNYVYTCFTSDFFHPAADEWRPEAWAMMKERSDLTFYFITKRPERFYVGLPDDWGDGYENIHIACTCENQYQTNKRLPIFLNLPIQHKEIIHEPMLEAINIRPFLEKYHNEIELVSCGGESGNDARVCDYGWVLNTLTQCVEYDVAFHFHQTGSTFRRGRQTYRIERKDQMEQAAKAGIDYKPPTLHNGN